MRQRGFTLVELVLVIAIMATLLGLATVQFSQYTTKANIEKQVREMYADLMNARSEALLQKKNRSVAMTAAQFALYTSINGTGTPILKKALKYPVTHGAEIPFYFDSRGVTRNKDGIPWQPGTTETVCVTPAGNPAAIDSLLITATGIQMGKWNGSCDSAHFTAK
ncbi:MAG TPA: type II secretion system protein [Geobacteraceae bacterium]